MGRYITGDIDHKLWFGTQSSNAASVFGGESENTNIPYYYNSMEDFDLGALKEKIDDFNKKYKMSITVDSEPNEIYSNDESWEVMQEDSNAADVQLGLKIYQCILANGSCEFEAEI